ncbi:MAG: SAVED domain-containing protein [Candidatus Jettenia sp.]|nr:SAVED domain-containing protein [Candidatus Jettenia sp.]
MSKIVQKKTKKYKSSNNDTCLTKGTSLTSPSGMGGIIGGKGYDYQKRYIVCHIPKWIMESNFTQLFHEGTGDVDIRYSNGDEQWREHIQIKDHSISKGEFRKVIDTFVKTDKGMPEVYHYFILACPSLDQKIRSLEASIMRLRNARPFYDDTPVALAPTEHDIRKIITDLNLVDYADFILGKLHFHVGLSDFHDDERASDFFISNLQKHPEYNQIFRNMVEPAYTDLLRKIETYRGKTINKVIIESLIVNSIRRIKKISEPAINLVIHNWTVEKFDIKPNHTLDWSLHFNRSSRIVPDHRTWNEGLLPELVQLREKIALNTKTRFIRFRGKCCLSTGLALGALFPTNGSWVFEVSQPPASTLWRSDAGSEINYPLNISEIDSNSARLDPNGDSLAFAFNITGSAQIDVINHIRDNSLPIKTLILIHPARSPSSLSIADDKEAISFAIAARDALKQAITNYNTRSIHLFFYGPLALAIFLGQRLTSLGTIQLYEFKDPGYVPSCTLIT